MIEKTIEVIREVVVEGVKEIDCTVNYVINKYMMHSNVTSVLIFSGNKTN